LFLRQFGPDYDVWASFVPPEFLPVLMSPPQTWITPICARTRSQTWCGVRVRRSVDLR